MFDVILSYFVHELSVLIQKIFIVMKILIVNPLLYSGNNNDIPKVDTIKDTMIYSMCLGFKSLGHQVTLVAMECYKPVKEEVYDFEVFFFKTNFDGFLNAALPLSFSLNKYIRRNAKKFDLIITSEVFALHSLCAVRCAPDKTLIWHELALHQKKFFHIPSKIWYNIVARLFMRKAFVVPRSESSKNFISQYMHHVADVPVEHGMDISKFKYSKEKKKQFIVIAQLVKRKNIPSIIEKFQRFLEKYDGTYKLLIAGRGELEEELRLLIQKKGLLNNVSMLGFMSHTEMNDVLPFSKAMLIDTKQDNNMVSIPESIVSGTPVITNSVPTNSYLIKLNHVGVVKDWNEDDMYEVASNTAYIDNCLKMRDDLSSAHQAQTLIKLFEQQKENIILL